MILPHPDLPHHIQPGGPGLTGVPTQFRGLPTQNRGRGLPLQLLPSQRRAGRWRRLIHHRGVVVNFIQQRGGSPRKGRQGATEWGIYIWGIFDVCPNLSFMDLYSN